jgi:hypothetical protein
LAIIAILFAASLTAQLPIDGLSAAPFGIAERAAEGVVSSGADATFLQIAFAD